LSSYGCDGELEEVDVGVLEAVEGAAAEGAEEAVGFFEAR
jgi:hypothetical protein